jgi:hypothetical protein
MTWISQQVQEVHQRSLCLALAQLIGIAVLVLDISVNIQIPAQGCVCTSCECTSLSFAFFNSILMSSTACTSSMLEFVIFSFDFNLSSIVCGDEDFVGHSAIQ